VTPPRPRQPVEARASAGGLRFRVLGSGSSGNTTLVEGGGTRVLVDAGLARRELAERLEDEGVDPCSISAVLVSHEHQDHARGAAAFSRRHQVRLAATRGTSAALGLDEAKLAGVDVLTPGSVFQVGALSVLPVAVPHDAIEPVGFVIECGGARLGHATDFGHLSRGLVEAFRDCDALLLESNYDPGLLRDGPYPWSLKQRIRGGQGHLANGDVARYLGSGLGPACRQVVLAHLSRTNNHPELALLSAERALLRAGRAEVRLSVCGAEAPPAITLAPRPVAPGGPEQLRLF
jgi:phosphoribosyl 1,2-cyclic phosphodiesterase